MGLNTKTTSGVGTPWYIYAIWPAGCIAFASLVPLLGKSIIPHIPTWDYIVSSIIMIFGISVTVYQVQTGGDTTKLPYVIQFLAILVFLIWAYSA